MKDRLAGTLDRSVGRWYDMTTMWRFGHTLEQVRSTLALLLHLVLVVSFLVASLAPVFALAQVRLNEIPERAEEEEEVARHQVREAQSPRLARRRASESVELVTRLPVPADRTRRGFDLPAVPAIAPPIISVPLRC